MTLSQQIITIAMCVLGTMLTRFLPFAVFSSKRPTPPYIQYLGKVLPGAIFFHAGGLLPATCFLTAGQSWVTGADRNSSDSWTSPVEKTNVVVYCRRYGLLYASYPVYLLRNTRI